MIKSFNINNFKSIKTVNLNLGVINVFIGENGAGKSNILEAIALAGAASASKLDNEFLASRGIRVTSPALMRSAFDDSDLDSAIEIEVYPDSGGSILYTLSNEGGVYSAWSSNLKVSANTGEVKSEAHKKDLPETEFFSILHSFMSNLELSKEQRDEAIESVSKSLANATKKFNKKSANSKKVKTFSISIDDDSPLGEYYQLKHSTIRVARDSLSDFIIYSPENSALRDFQREGQILPLGINGEGLFKLLEFEISSRGEEYLFALNKFLSLFGWFDNIKVSNDEFSLKTFEISDRYICAKNNRLDLKVANEGFLFLIFYFALFSSSLTPRFFAIDNIDASLNPKLCRKLIEELGRLAKINNKQVLLTTHNPAVLDGLDLDDELQRLLIIERDLDGLTEVRRVKKPKAIQGAPLLRLSEAFMRGSLGGLPKGF